MADYRSLRIERPTGAIAELVLAGPGRGNAMGPDFWRELPAAVAGIEADRAVRALVVRGSGEHYSYGLDLPAMGAELSALLADGAAGRAAVVEQARGMERGFAALAASRLPVVAAVDGWCIGAGIEMIAACDLRLATTRARFALREVKVGMVADLGGIQRLPHLVGEAWARELALTGDDIDAATALRIGLVTRLVDPPQLVDEARALAARVAANPPLVVAAIKQVMNARIDAAVAAGNLAAATQNGLLMQSEDFAEAMRAFMERRAAVFRGR